MKLSITGVRRVLGRLIERQAATTVPPPGPLKATIYCPPHRVDVCIAQGTR